MSTNGDHNDEQRRPFGPHGENCTCEWGIDEEPGPEDELAVQEDPAAKEERVTVSDGEISEQRHELVFSAVSDYMVQEFLTTSATLLEEDNALNRGQLTAMIGCLMRGFADAKQAGWHIERGFLELIEEADAHRSAQETPVEPLGDLKAVFES